MCSGMARHAIWVMMATTFSISSSSTDLEQCQSSNITASACLDDALTAVSSEASSDGLFLLQTNFTLRTKRGDDDEAPTVSASSTSSESTKLMAAKKVVGKAEPESRELAPHHSEIVQASPHPHSTALSVKLDSESQSTSEDERTARLDENMGNGSDIGEQHLAVAQAPSQSPPKATAAPKNVSNAQHEAGPHNRAAGLAILFVMAMAMFSFPVLEVLWARYYNLPLKDVPYALVHVLACVMIFCLDAGIVAWMTVAKTIQALYTGKPMDTYVKIATHLVFVQIGVIVFFFMARFEEHMRPTNVFLDIEDYEEMLEEEAIRATSKSVGVETKTPPPELFGIGVWK
eukprot:gnl/TRDRNA2_/TRDRNA2_81629_c0_seq1.p1 gnl/TRDRNA2_/TRDRNA2_81629_c0~~gnl/TRDRNA2_/TRDRNA2_81629_c0_seq1.p1  ORF type:complete len:345 (-),score=54.97 gnl/TRDRNA2_/TRDRNA2_81629_c0_seq1:19-1053(-)